MSTDLTARIAELAASVEARLAQEAAHIVRNGPDRTRRRVAATRALVAAIMAEPHNYVPGGEYYSCSQAAAGTGAVSPDPGDMIPGSGCSDTERAGQPCDCGRDARVARLLGIIASEWEGNVS